MKTKRKRYFVRDKSKFDPPAGDRRGRGAGDAVSAGSCMVNHPIRNGKTGDMKTSSILPLFLQSNFPMIAEPFLMQRNIFHEVGYGER
jgi:hypothetical protein